MLSQFTESRWAVSVGIVGIGALLLASSAFADTSPETEKSRLSKSAAIRLAAKCIRDAQPEVKVDVKSAIVRYYRKAKAYGGDSLWLIGFPEADRRVGKDSDAKNAHTGLFRMVWIKGDGSYSGNDVGELPLGKKPISLGPEHEAEAVKLAKAFLGRHYPHLDISRQPPSANYNRDNRSFGGAPVWIVSFSYPVGKDGRPTVGAGPYFHPQGVLVTREGALMLGMTPMIGPPRPPWTESVNAKDGESPNTP